MSRLLLKDPLYGSADVKEDVLVALIGSKHIQRLNGISQGGLPKGMQLGGTVYSTRYDHSVGCMMLLRKLGASLEEQVAGLLHDVSHTAFSHVVDWIVGDPRLEDFQDKRHRSYFDESGLTELLDSHGFRADRIAELTNFSLLEREAPDICADRVDYSSRDSMLFLKMDMNRLLTHLRVVDGEIVFDSQEAARTFGNAYMRCQIELWAADDTAARWYAFSSVLKDALASGIITMADFEGTDDPILEKIRSFGGQDLKARLTVLYGDFSYKVVKQGGTHLAKKFRRVDPKFETGGKLVRLTRVDDAYKNILESEKARCQNGVNVAV